ncbi:MAG: PVC-type heme-binding CxxCH protein [Verrucomicrobiota bacterium]
MKFKLALFSLWLCFSISGSAQENKPLRIFLRAGPKTHGPGQHDGPRWLAEWKPLLSERGATVDGAIGFPTAVQLEQMDVLVMYSAEGGTIQPDDRANLDQFLKRGGGLVAIHDSVCGNDAPWFKTIIGGAWEHGYSKWFEGDIALYYTDRAHPITKDVSNFDFDDEMYWNLHLMPEARILAATYAPDRRNTKGGRMFPSVYDIVPQMWVYEKTVAGGQPYRAFVCIPGHHHKSFSLPHFRAVLLRGIAWAGQRDADSLCNQEELAALRYPEGGPTAPEKAAEKIVVHPEFDISLVAAEPLINKPISLDWDPAGRMWVAETPEYPNGRRINPNDKVVVPWKDKDPESFVGGKDPRPARDRISILTNPDEHGRYQKKSIFYEGLELVTSLVLYRDGVIVSQAPEVLRLRDTDGDGQADKVETLYTGFGTGDTHAVISNLRWGLDGWIYATVGYSRGDIYSGNGKTHFGRVTEGVIRFQPDGSALEQVSSKGSNTWGMDFDWDGELFFTQATSGDHLMHVVLPESVLARGKVGSTASFRVTEDHKKSFPLMTWPKQAYVQIDVVGGYTAVSGSCLYTGGAWPARWNGSHFCSEPTINVVHHDFLKPAGASYLATREKEEEFIGSRDLWFRPIHTRIGPDGALYVTDFCNQAVVHNDTRGTRHGANNAAVRPDRDHYFGRVWRVQHKEAKPLPPVQLDPKQPAALVTALEHPNGWVRMTAQRLLDESGPAAIVPELEKLLLSDKPAPARLQALWVLANRGPLPARLLAAAINDVEPALRKNALRIAAASGAATAAPLQKSILARLNDPDPRARLEAISALGSLPDSPEIARALVSVYPQLNDPWLQSAAIGVANKAPLACLEAALAAATPEGLNSLVAQLSAQIAGQQDAAAAAQLVTLLATQPATADSLKQVILENLAAGLKSDSAPVWSPELQSALQTLLASTNESIGTVALPLLANWDKTGALRSDVSRLIRKVGARLQEAGQSDEQRILLATSLLSVQRLDAEIVPAVVKILGSNSSAELQRRVLAALGSMADPAIGSELVNAHPRLAPELQEAAFGQIVKRADWALALLEAVKSGRISLTTLGPSSVHRLRTHNDSGVAQKAAAIIDEVRGPEVKEKNELMARFTPLVMQPGHAESGQKLFAQNCATCHKFNGQGTEVGPELTGMGAHGPADLLMHILDPNRFVEENFVATSIETKEEEIYDGVVIRENRSSVILRNASGEFEIKPSQIKSRRATGLSLMPNGFEALGGEALRDILAYLCAGESRHRLLDLTSGFTANSTRGIYTDEDSVNESLRFKKFGVIKVGSVPFDIVSPSRSPTGRNLIVLKGRNGMARQFPQRVEIKAGMAASKLHFLGGVGAWAYPCCGDNKNEHLPVAKVTVRFADGQTEEMVLQNGVEFADYSGQFDVPGSKEVHDVVRSGQVRWFTKPLKHQGVIDRIDLESYDNVVAPTFVAITAELATPGTTAEAPASSSPSPASSSSSSSLSSSPSIRALIVGGGSSHDFDRWFNQADTATLRADGQATVHYTDKPEAILPALGNLDVLYLSNNQPLSDSALRQGIFQFADSGKGLLLAHPALWYNWNDWPEYNRQFVGGGARSHDKYGEFEVTVDDPAHPIMAGVPGTFRIKDELYHFQKDALGMSIQVLATGRNLATGKSYPVVWISQHPKARIICISLGHDGAAHEHPALQTLLRNSLRWAAGKR